MTLKELLLFGLILFFALFTRLFRLAYPAAMYFDEIYHVPAATLMHNGDFQTPFKPVQFVNDEQNVVDWLHPPLAKYFQAFSISIWGMTSIAWRLPSVIFSLLTLIIFYFFVRFLGKNFFFKKESLPKRIDLSINLALAATFFLSLDGLFLVQSRIAMNDIFLLFFVITAVFVYFIYLVEKKPLILFASGTLFGLALASKWSALWVLLLLLMKEWLELKNIRKLPFLFFSLLLTPFFVYLLSYLPMFWQGQNIIDFFLLQKTIFLSQLTNPATHLYSSDPLTWILNLRPVWYFTASAPEFWISNIYALGNPLLCAYLLATLVASVFFLIKGKINFLERKAIYLILLLYSFSFLPWLLFSRIMFLHHYLLALTFLIILLSYFFIIFSDKIRDKNKQKAVIFNFLFWPFLFFILFYPHWTALVVPTDFAEIVYFLLPSWR